MRKTTTILFLLLAVICVPAFGTNLVTFNVTARVDTVEDSLGVLGGSILVGDTLTGIIQYDLDLPDDDPGANSGNYFASPPGDNFIEGTNGASGFFKTIDFFDIATLNDAFDGDSVEFFASGDTTPSSLAHPDIDYVDIFILLRDDDSTVFSDDSPPASLNLADFEEARIEFSSEDIFFNFGYFVNATITSITQVPEPSTMLLGAVAGIGLLFGRRRLR